MSQAFVDRQLGLLGAQDPVEMLRASPQRLQQIVERIGPAGLARASGEGKWTGAQILAHLADMEIVFGYRVRQTLAEDGHTLQLVEQEAWAERYRNVDARAALASFAALRAWNVALVSTLGESDRARSYTHPERGPETLEKLLRLWAGHDLNHGAQLEGLA